MCFWYVLWFGFCGCLLWFLCFQTFLIYLDLSFVRPLTKKLGWRSPASRPFRRSIAALPSSTPSNDWALLGLMFLVRAKCTITSTPRRICHCRRYNAIPQECPLLKQIVIKNKTYFRSSTCLLTMTAFCSIGSSLRNTSRTQRTGWRYHFKFLNSHIHITP